MADTTNTQSTPAAGTPNITSVTGTDGVTRAVVGEATPPAAASQPQGERPSWLPEGFDSPEALAQAYATLKGTATPQAPTTQTPADATKVVQAAGLDMTALTNEFATTGQLSAESIAKLGEKGITPEQVNAYVEGQKAIAQQMTTTLTEVVGGAEAMQTMLAWAKSNLTPAEAQAYDTAVKSGNTALATMALRGVHAQFLAAAGSDPSLLNASSEPTLTGVVPFKSNAEVVTAMQDKRYKSDPAYRATVERRLMVTETQNVRTY